MMEIRLETTCQAGMGSFVQAERVALFMARKIPLQRAMVCPIQPAITLGATASYELICGKELSGLSEQS